MPRAIGALYSRHAQRLDPTTTWIIVPV